MTDNNSTEDDREYFARMVKWTIDYHLKLENSTIAVTGEMVEEGLMHLYEYHHE